MLLNEVLAWMRTQPGTEQPAGACSTWTRCSATSRRRPIRRRSGRCSRCSSRRAPSASACVLATQNPVDLDYKGLSNAGTWFLGRLQTERDKARVLDGLEGASAPAGAAFDRQKMEATLAGLGNRVFLMNNVHDDEPVVFQTRWALSYLRGPLTREQIRTLPGSAPAAATTPGRAAPAATAPGVACGCGAARRAAGAAGRGRRGLLPPTRGAPARVASSSGRRCSASPTCTSSTRGRASITGSERSRWRRSTTPATTRRGRARRCAPRPRRRSRAAGAGGDLRRAAGGRGARASYARWKSALAARSTAATRSRCSRAPVRSSCLAPERARTSSGRACARRDAAAATSRWRSCARATRRSSRA